MLSFMMPISLVLMFMESPLGVGVFIVAFTLALIILVGKGFSLWMSIVFFLIYVGGVLMIFVYLTSVDFNIVMSSGKFVLSQFVLFLILTKLFMLLVLEAPGGVNESTLSMISIMSIHPGYLMMIVVLLIILLIIAKALLTSNKMALRTVEF